MDRIIKPQPQEEEAQAIIAALAGRVYQLSAHAARTAPARLADLAARYGNNPRMAAMIDKAAEDWEKVPHFFAAVTYHQLQREMRPAEEDPTKDDNVIDGEVVVIEEARVTDDQANEQEEEDE